MPKVNRLEVDKKDFLVVKDTRTLDVTKVIAPHELQIGLEGYKRASLRIEGDEHITGRLTIEDGCKGALRLFDGTSAIKAGVGTLVTTSSDGSATVALDTSYIASQQAGVVTAPGGGLSSVADPNGLLSLSVDPTFLQSKILAGAGISVSNNNGQLTISNTRPSVVAGSGLSSNLAGGNLTFNLDIVAGAGIQVNTNGSGKLEISSQVTGESTFQNDIVVSLSNGKTFGRYVSGDTIPATGKTAAEVLALATVEPINPTVGLTSSTTIAFNQTAISNVLNFSHTINSLNATVSTAVLQWRRGNSGSWTTLSSGISSSGNFTHTLTDTAFNGATFNYRYVVTDSVGATATAILDITPAGYIAPTISLSVVGASLNPIETNLKRERGNVSSNLSGTITRNSPMVGLVSYVLQYSTDGNTWVDINQAPVSIGPGTSSVTQINHNNLDLKTSASILYRVRVIDTYQQHLSAYGITGGLTTVSFLNLIFFGSVAQAPANSNAVRALSSKIFTDGSNPFSISTGTVNKVFSFAVPASTNIVNVIDVDALNANITTSYVKSTFNVLDFGGTAVSYDIYTMTNAEPYSPNTHNHQVTRS